jgi:hypothetical protein
LLSCFATWKEEVKFVDVIDFSIFQQSCVVFRSRIVDELEEKHYKRDMIAVVLGLITL